MHEGLLVQAVAGWPYGHPPLILFIFFFFLVVCTMIVEGVLTSVHIESWAQRVCHVVAVKGWYACGGFLPGVTDNRVMTVA